jgi:hypothetical protein
MCQLVVMNAYGVKLTGMSHEWRNQFECYRPPSPHHSIGARLDHLAEEFWTIEEVISEVRDSRSRALLASLPFDLKVKVPSDEAIKFGECLYQSQ